MNNEEIKNKVKIILSCQAETERLEEQYRRNRELAYSTTEQQREACSALFPVLQDGAILVDIHGKTYVCFSWIGEVVVREVSDCRSRPVRFDPLP